ncbi:MAG: hypothetical protein HRU19_30525 [Pseudobacteriovorax sp.]|nr:hypothetical protein [Pseudobacteriovorax sp.]
MVKKLSFSNLDITIEEQADSICYTFSGEVDENFNQTQVPRIRKSKIYLELGNIEQFNSVGIREWLLFIRDLKKQGSLVFKSCSVAVIDQINMVPDSLGNGVVESFYAPYYCDCGKEVNKLIDTAECIGNLSSFVAPQFKCECGKNLEFDALEESYFQFVGNMKKTS